MKKLIIGISMLVLSASGIVSAQTHRYYDRTPTVFTARVVPPTTKFIQLGVSSGTSNVLNENLEFGAQSGKNRVSLVGQTFEQSNDVRKVLVGLKYLRVLPLFTDVSANASLAAKTRVDHTAFYVIEPGVGMEYTFAKNVSLLAGVSVPYRQTATTPKSSLGGNASIKFTL